MERLQDSRHLCPARWEAAVDTRPRFSSRQYYIKKRYLHVELLFPTSSYFPKKVPHSLAPHDSSPFTAECSILLQLSLVVWQKNWKSTDYVYFQNRAYQSVIRPLWCSLLYLQLMIHVISVPSPRMCCFPSRQGYLEYFVWAICVCVGGLVYVCVIYFSNYMNDPFKQLHYLGTQGHNLFTWKRANSSQACMHFYFFIDMWLQFKWTL